MSGIKLLLDDSRGIYIPKAFVEGFDLTLWVGADASDLEECKNPDGECYWEAWDAICQNVTHTDEKGNVWRLWQDGALFAVCDALMTDEEHEQFFGEPREPELVCGKCATFGTNSKGPGAHSPSCKNQ